MSNNIYESTAKDKAIAQAKEWIAGKQCAPGVKEVFVIMKIENGGWTFFPASDIYAKQKNLMGDVVERFPVI